MLGVLICIADEFPTFRAADLVAKSLVEDEDLQHHTDVMLRQYAFRYSENRIPAVCKRIVHVWRENEIDYPTIGDVDKYRLVISTAYVVVVMLSDKGACISLVSYRLNLQSRFMRISRHRSWDESLDTHYYRRGTSLKNASDCAIYMFQFIVRVRAVAVSR